MIFMRMCNTGPGPGESAHSPILRDYLMSNDFRESKAGIWATRHDTKEIPGLQERVERLMKDNGLEISGLKVFGGKRADSSPIFRILVLPEQTPDHAVIYDIENLIESMKKYWGEN